MAYFHQNSGNRSAFVQSLQGDYGQNLLEAVLFQMAGRQDSQAGSSHHVLMLEPKGTS